MKGSPHRRPGSGALPEIGTVRWGLLLGMLAACSKSTALPAPTAPTAPTAPSTVMSGSEPGSGQDQYRQPQRLIAALGPLTGRVVAEIGAGGGYLTLRLAAAVGPTGQVVATDISAQALAALSKRAAPLPQVVTRLVTAEASGLEANRYDLILLAEVDHLLRDRVAYVQTLRTALRAGGRIAISNKIHHLPALQKAIAATGFHSQEISANLPAQFLLMLSL